MALREDIEPRKYQVEIAESALRNGNTLVVLPTGMGKTLIAVLVIEKKIKEGAVLFLAPTKPLVDQHLKTIKDLLPGVDAVAITGEMSKKKRQELWKSHMVIVATPQTVENDLNIIDKNRFSLLVIDEAHKAIGKYAYAEVAQQFRPYSMILGLTASPGGKKAKIEEITKTLGIVNVESRDHFDEDVRPYVKEIEIEWIKVDEHPQYVEAKKRLRALLDWYLDMVRHYGFSVHAKKRKAMIAAQQSIMKSKLKSKYHALKYLSAAINLDYALEMLETQSMDAFLIYTAGLSTRKTKGAQLLSRDGRLHDIIEYVKQHKVIHPKMQKLVELIQANRDAKYIVFSQYTSQIEYLERALTMFGFKCKRFIGQRHGFTRKQQLDAIEQFRKGEFDILIASSIGEEGLDIPSVDYVIFYEPIPSEIRSIQRRGRAGRVKKGFVKVLITKNTRDEAAYYVSQRKEKHMKKIIKSMKSKSGCLSNTHKPTGTLMDYF